MLSGEAQAMPSFFWTSGSKREDVTSRLPWPEKLFYRLTARYDLVPAVQSTIEAEIGFGIPHCTYFQIGRCEPWYGEVGIAFTAEGQTALVTPFGVGALWADVVPLSPEKESSETCKRQLLDELSRSEALYAVQLSAWLDEAYPQDHADYVRGAAPSKPASDCLGPYAESTPSIAWTWEARIPVHRAKWNVAPVRLAMSRTRLKEYVQWFVNTPLVDHEAKQKHIDSVYSIHLDPGMGSAADTLNTYLEHRIA